MAASEVCARCGGAVRWAWGAEMARCEGCGRNAAACDCPARLEVSPDRADTRYQMKRAGYWAEPDQDPC